MLRANRSARTMHSTALFLEQLHTAASLWRHPRSARVRLARFQSRKLRLLAQHAYHRVPLYRRLFDKAGVTPRDLHSAADLVHLPITTKAERRQRPVVLPYPEWWFVELESIVDYTANNPAVDGAFNGPPWRRVTPSRTVPRHYQRDIDRLQPLEAERRIVLDRQARRRPMVYFTCLALGCGG